MFQKILPGQIVSKTFIDTFVYMGGTGTLLGLVIAIFIFSKNGNSKKLARLARHLVNDLEESLASGFKEETVLHESSLLMKYQPQFDNKGKCIGAESLLGNVRTKEIINSIVYLSKSLGFKVLAEFVETNEQKEALESIGVNLYQGYLYSPAIDKAAFLKMK